MPLVTSAAWRTELLQRVRAHFFLKFVGVCAFMWLFFSAYFHLLRFPAYPVTEMPLTLLDRAIPFQPEWLGAYLSLWVYTGIPPGLMLRLREASVYGLWAAGLCLCGLICFYFWPTAVPPIDIDVSQYPGFQVLRGVDAGGNACPSLHVGSAVFSAFWIERLLRHMGTPWWLRGLNIVWCAAIVFSTMAVKQHVALDVLSGGLLGAVFALISMRLTAPESRPMTEPAG